MKILLAVDGSPCSDKAVEEIARRSWPAQSEIKVLTAIELPIPSTPEAWTIPPSYLEELDRASSDQARSVVERAVAKLKAAMGSEANVKVRPYLVHPGGDFGRSGKLGCRPNRGRLTWLSDMGTVSARIGFTVRSFAC
jgi:hypothetical protein